jgi:predicted DNA-binding transcriptional regulator YafY
MNRIDRLSAILIQLQSRRLVKAQQIAEKFSISLRTVYRDVHALQESGVPIIGEAGTGYSLMEGYKLPPVMFNTDEASALLTAAKLMQSKTDKNSSKHYTSALDKIKAVLRMSEKDHIEDIDEHIVVIQHPAIRFEPPQELFLQPILKSISGKQVAEIIYHTPDKAERTTRKIEPVGIFNLGVHWHLVAFCRLRNDYRNFRADRIENFNITDEIFTTNHPPLQSFINKTASKREVTKIVMDAEKEVVKYLSDQKFYCGFVHEEDLGRYMRMTFLCGSLEGFARWFLMFGDHAAIVEPAELNDLIISIAENIVKKIEETQMLLT